MPSKGLYKPLIKSYDQFNISQNSENPKFKCDFPMEKGSENFMTEKASQLLRNLVIFLKKCQKTMISSSKT